VPYTIWSGRDNGACRRKLSERSSRETPRQTGDAFTESSELPPRRQQRRGSGATGVGEREQPPDEPRRVSRLATLPCRHGRPRGAKTRANHSATQLLLATTAVQEKCGGAALQQHGEANDAIGLLKRRRSTAPRLASPVKHGHGGGHPRLRSGRSDPRSPPLPGIKPASTLGKDRKPRRQLPAPPHRRSRPASPARATAVWAGSLGTSPSYCRRERRERGKLLFLVIQLDMLQKSPHLTCPQIRKCIYRPGSIFGLARKHLTVKHRIALLQLCRDRGSGARTAAPHHGQSAMLVRLSLRNTGPAMCPCLCETYLLTQTN
jgi:hypothetical protein